MGKIKLSFSRRDPAVVIKEIAVQNERLVYAIITDKKLKYPKGRSSVVYFGKTGKGIERIAKSAEFRSKQIFKCRGVKEFSVIIIKCKNPTNNIIDNLENVFLVTFREKYGRLPLCNKNVRKLNKEIEFDLFRRKRIEEIIRDLE